MSDIVDTAVRDACELPGDDGIPDDQRLILSISDLRVIVSRALEDQAATIATLREALEPFAARAAIYERDEPTCHINDDCQLWQLEGNSGMRVDITVGNLREARAALQGSSTEKEKP